jgi:TetR/AcrR family transcriptional repressor of nem operon
MGRPKLAESKDTRGQLIRVAMEMIQTRGYNAFSYQDLADHLNIRKASIHYYFPSKEDLGVSLLEFAAERFEDWRQKNQDQDLSALTQIESYFDYFASIAGDGTRICPGGALAAEWGALPAKLQAAVEKLLAANRDWLKEVLQKGRRAGEIAKRGTLEEQVQFVGAALQGALLTSRAQGNPAYFRAVTRQVVNSLKAE